MIYVNNGHSSESREGSRLAMNRSSQGLAVFPPKLDTVQAVPKQRKAVVICL